MKRYAKIFVSCLLTFTMVFTSVQWSAIVNETTMVGAAHRLSTIRHADKIVVLDEGAVAECGSHEELLARKGHYYDSYQKD